SGRLLIQAKYYIPMDTGSKETHRVLFYSDDHGQTWHHGADMDFTVSMSDQEFPIVESKPNEIYINIRNSSDFRLTMRSPDGGLTVSYPVPDYRLPAPHCHASLIRYLGAMDSTILFCCPRDESRELLTVHLSRDGGHTWLYSRLVCDGLSGYSDVAWLPDSSIVCLYESGLENMCDFMEVARFNLDWLTEYIENDSLYQESTIFQGGTEGYYMYASPTIICAANKNLLAFCEGRKSGPANTGDIDIVMKRSTDLGLTWSAIQVICDDSINTCGNPAPVIDRETGTIFLLMTWNHGDDNETVIIDQTGLDTRRIFVASSVDHGATWTEPRDITQDVKPPDATWFVTGPVHGIQLQRGAKKGRLVIPCNYILAGNKQRCSGVFYSDDHGLSWQQGGQAAEDQTGECTVAELADGLLMINMANHDRSSKTRKIAFSADGGVSWCDEYFDPALIEPIAQASLLRYSFSGQDRSRLLFSNPALTYTAANLTIRYSYDEGTTWSEGRTINRGSSGNSDLTALRDHTIGLVYERDARLKINFARFNLYWLTFGLDTYQLTRVPDRAGAALPAHYVLGNYPNPFNSETRMRFQVPQRSNVQIDIFDMAGRKIKALVKDAFPAGIFDVVWHADDDRGCMCPSGLYLYRVTTGGFTGIQRMVLLR
ncbi:exo-alpha-sialidase, partial [candidate division KSB1 bacterium]|nr:exo-alpha-sialidase [candidate division KSB1 bacterium]